ncbi:DUF6884 domain-containing protein [Virgibacillus kekensis]|uniref:DUF6884 domain-containing protein n=1 Tax=Virgibacillus kekensis TaxID=202261 RepID=A0ABV9DDL5_9BACI
MRELSIIPCGRKKIWDKYPDLGPVPAGNAYTGTLHTLCRKYAEKYTDDWVILSAKHGFLSEDDLVEGQYDVTFGQKSNEIISFAKLREQIKEKGLDQYDNLVVLTGKKYKPVINGTFIDDLPRTYPLTRYKGIGYILQALNQSIKSGEPIHEKK